MVGFDPWNVFVWTFEDCKQIETNWTLLINNCDIDEY